MIVYLWLIQIIQGQIKIESTRNNPAYILLSNELTQYTIKMTPQGQIDISNKTHNFISLSNNTMTFNEHLSVDKIESYQALSYGLNAQNQWNQYILTNFQNQDNDAERWEGRVTDCGGHSILGGYLIAQNQYKNAYSLPKHHFVKIAFNFYLIDNWRGESLYLKVNMEYIWVQKQDNSLEIGNSCGDPELSDLTNQYQEITFQHTEQVLAVEFGSTMGEQPDRGWWGISDFQIYLK